MTKEELQEILRKHKLWLQEKEGGERADLSGKDLSKEDLIGVDLRDANLNYADLRNADLRNANLNYADLKSADLRNANLMDANLSGVILRNTKSDLISFCGFGSENRTTVYSPSMNIIWCGCFKGTLEEFENKVIETYKKDSQYHKEYTAMIKMIKSLNN